MACSVVWRVRPVAVGGPVGAQDTVIRSRVFKRHFHRPIVGRISGTNTVFGISLLLLAISVSALLVMPVSLLARKCNAKLTESRLALKVQRAEDSENAHTTLKSKMGFQKQGTKSAYAKVQALPLEVSHEFD